MHLQLKMSREGQDRGKRMAVVKKLLSKGQVSLSGAMAAKLKSLEESGDGADSAEYQSINKPGGPPPAVREYLKEICYDAFQSYDADGNGQLDRREVYVFFRDFHENISEEEVDRLFEKTDTDNSGAISFDEFIGLAYGMIKAKESGELDGSTRGTTKMMADSVLNSGEE